MKYYYDREEKKQFNIIEFPVQQSFDYYSKWTGYHSDQQVKVNVKKYGANRFGHVLCFLVVIYLLIGWIFLHLTS